MNTYNTALPTIMRVYNELITTTLSMDDIEDTIIRILIRNGASRANARRWTRDYLDN